MTAIQAVFIRGYEERTHPKPHTVYRIDIQAHVRSWQMWRRYSEFDDLHTEITKAAGSPPPSPLPPKHKFSLLRSHTDTKVLEERRIGLEIYLRAIVSAKEDKWRDTFAFKDFLGVPVGRPPAGGGVVGSPSSQFTSATWLDEHLELQAKLRDVWADINKRNALSDRGDVAEAHKSNVAAKSKLAGVLSRIGTLGEGLQYLGMAGMSEGELQRRTDMVARLQDTCEKLGKVVSVARQTSARPSGASSAVPAPDSDREALLGTQAMKPARRVFGAPPQETEASRPLDNVGLLQMQQTQMEQQDNQMSQLTTILQRQRHLGEAIGAEIALQNEMLDDLSNEVDRVGGKLHDTSKQMNKLS
ncbi:syntaxin [Crassisporium funariophilum]|nr:syntaxin [Crassisporium funariophilum]